MYIITYHVNLSFSTSFSVDIQLERGLRESSVL